MAARSTQRFILPRLISWVSGTPGNWMVKSNLSPCSGYVALREKGSKVLFHHGLITWFAYLALWIHASVKFFTFLKIKMTDKINWKRVTKIILNGKKAAGIFSSKFWTFKLLHSYMKHLYQMIDYINWLTASYTIKQSFLICYNIIIPYVQTYHALTFLW